MSPSDVEVMLKQNLGFLKPFDKEGVRSFNSAITQAARQIATKSGQELRDAKKKAEESSSNAEFSKNIQKFIDNPMSKEEESKALRAILHANLATGELSPQLLDKLDKIIGVSTEKDEVIELVDFESAFPSYAEAIRICSKPMPEE